MQKPYALPVISDFLIKQCSHTECPFNPDCPAEKVEQLLSLLSPKLKSAVEYLRVNHLNPEFNVARLVDKFNLSLRELERLFKTELGCTPKECLEQIRIYHVRKQLDENPYRSRKVAFTKAGFNSRSSFEYARRKYPPPRNRKFNRL